MACAFKESSPVASSGPDVAIFKRFQQSWSYIDQSHYDTGDTHEAVSHAIAGVKADVIEFALNQLSETLPRDDYRELLELTLTFLGVINLFHHVESSSWHQVHFTKLGG